MEGVKLWVSICQKMPLSLYLRYRPGIWNLIFYPLRSITALLLSCAAAFGGLEPEFLFPAKRNFFLFQDALTSGTVPGNPCWFRRHWRFLPVCRQIIINFRKPVCYARYRICNSEKTKKSSIPDLPECAASNGNTFEISCTIPFFSKGMPKASNVYSKPAPHKETTATQSHRM